MTPGFNSQLTDFQRFAQGVDPEFGRQVSDVIATSYISQLSAADNAAVTTVQKLGSLVDTLGATYLKSVESYYLAKGKIADLKLAAKGSAATQVVNTAQGAIALPPTNLLLFGGLGLAALFLLRR